MVSIRRSDERGQAEHGWLSSKHTFSFAGYYDPRFTGYRDLLVINEDRVAPSQGFGTHGHRDMEIVSYVLDGALEHADSMGNGSIIRPGDVQRMTAGTGVRHSEYNHSKQSPVHFLQIWIRPERNGLEPSYEQKHFTREEKLNQLRLVASRDGRDGSVTIHQDVSLYASILEPGHAVQIDRGDERRLWVQVASGAVRLGGVLLTAGDGVSVDDLEQLTLEGVEPSELLVFDLA